MSINKTEGNHMAISDLNKEYLKYTKEEATKWHFYLGGDPALRPDDNPNAFDWGTDVNFLYRVRQNDVNFVTDRVDWAANIMANPWSPNTNTDNKTLVYNKTNSIAYLCISDNFNNRSDTTIRGKQVSTYTPSHVTGIQTYPDGYSWFALFVVEPSKYDLITTSKIPVMSLDDYTTDITNTSLTQKYSQLCNSGYTAAGTCCLYNKQEYKDGVGITFAKGSLSFVKTVTNCYRCNELASALNLEYVFKGGVTSISAYPTCSPCDCSIELVDKISEIEKNLDNLNPAGFYKHIYANYQGWEDPSEILSVFIDLTGLTDDQKIVSAPNPEVLFTSITGTNGKAELITDDIGNNTYRVTGIRLITRGKNYKNGDATPKFTNITNDTLLNRIEVNVAPEDFPENPISMLNNLETCIKVSVSNKMLEESNTNIRNFTRYGIIRDIKLNTDNTNAADGLNTNEYQVLRATSVLTLGVTLPTGPVLGEPGYEIE